MDKIGFIGAGTVGTALALRLKGRGYPVVASSSRTLASAQRLASLVEGSRAFPRAQDVADRADLVFITTPDYAIGEVAASVKWHEGQGVVHCSGADSIDILEPAKQYGAQVGAFHPLQTFASLTYAIENIPGSTFALEGRGALLNKLQELATSLDGNWIVLKPQDKVLYHASAVIACNYFVTLVKLATDLWQSFGIPNNIAIKSLTPLLKGTLNNLNNVGLPNALTGPIARGDLGTILKHLKALEERYPSLLSTYKELGLQTIPIALAKGKLYAERAENLKEILNKKTSTITEKLVLEGSK